MFSFSPVPSNGRMGRRLRRLVGMLPGIALAVTLAAPAQGALADSTPRELVMKAAEDLMTGLVVSGEEVRQDRKLAYDLAEKTIFPLIDFERISKLVLGKHWRRASGEQRESFANEFEQYARDFLVAAMVTYSQEITGYSGKLEFPPMRRSSKEDRAVVRMRIKTKTGASADVDYRMIRSSENWKIYDVRVEGISMVLSYRENFASEIQRFGLPGVIDRMAARNRGETGADDLSIGSPRPSAGS